MLDIEPRMSDEHAPDEGRALALCSAMTVARRILRHLGLDSQGPPVVRAQAPPKLFEPGPEYDIADLARGH